MQLEHRSTATSCGYPRPRRQPEQDARTLALISAARHGNPRAKRAVVERLLPSIRRRVRWRLGRGSGLPSLQEPDAVQEIWLVLLKDDCAQLCAWDPARGRSIDGYVGMIVDRVLGNLRDHARAQKRESALVGLDCVPELPDDGAGPERALIAHANAEGLLKHLHRSLSERGRHVLGKLCEDASASDIASTLGVSRQVVYNWRYEIRQQARGFVVHNEQ